ncbi:MAG: Bifunctional protein GlmU [candidate division TM6 bacterium GW2011_GWF2_32_72]|nr:MAG: Bifunctional protein GlmU [candidate division TM6 bacterium GW2011_GWF2_32_72]
MNKKLQAVILAAGRSSRFKTGKSKLLEQICSREMIIYPTKLLEKLEIPTTIVVGYQKEQVVEVIKKYHKDSINFAEQTEQLGTGHALLCSKEFWEADDILVMNGDTPLIPEWILKKLIEEHNKQDAEISFIKAHNTDPSTGAYGRVVRSEGKIRIVEPKDFSGYIEDHPFINSGIYIIKKNFLEKTISQINNNNNSNEFYIVDLIGLASEKGLKIGIVQAPFDLMRGVNTLKELWAAEHIKRSELIKYWMEKGVRFNVAQNVHIDLDVEIGPGTTIGSSAQLFSGTRIGANCEINSFCSLINCIVEDNVIIHTHCSLSNSVIKEGAQVGPFAFIKGNSVIGKNSHIGSFVEVKNSIIGEDSEAKHLNFLGDAEIGNKVTIGAGTITCNNNGYEKLKTKIEDEAFIGSSNSLVAPVTIGKNAFTAAGSVITEDVPEKALGIARSRQINKPDYAPKIKEKIKHQSSDKKNLFIGAIKTTESTQTTE